MDSYSDGDSCYCSSNFDHDISGVNIDTPLGIMNISSICALLGNGPTGSRVGRPWYNDIQCGNGPANTAGDEDDCPGRTEYGQEGCKYIGPKWNFIPHMPKNPVSPPRPVAPPKPVPVAAPKPTPVAPKTVAPVSPPRPIPVAPPKPTPVATPKAAPVTPPRTPPVTTPVNVPRNAPVTPPMAPPVSTPVNVPRNAPVTPPRTAPVSTPVNAPRAAPVTPPMAAPTEPAPLCKDFVSFDDNLTAGEPTIGMFSYDSYSVGDDCYCRSTNPDASIANVTVMVPETVRNRTGTNIVQLRVKDICKRLGPGPGSQGRPWYNDIQCGNGPSSTSPFEVTCPGRVEYGAGGCKFLGPKWNWDKILNTNRTSPPADPVAPLCMDWVRMRPNITAGLRNVSPSSYSVGDECYCHSTINQRTGDIMVPVPPNVGSSMGTTVTALSVSEICTRLGPGPGSIGRPLYNDVQCGNGPRTSNDEKECPGRTEHGAGGCNFLGPRWNWTRILRT